MAVRFPELDAEAPAGAVIGVIGADGAAKALKSDCGSILRIGPSDVLELERADLVLLEHALATRDAWTRARAAARIEELRRGGTTVVLVSHDEELLRVLCDEVWWVHEGRLAGRGEPEEILTRYRRHVAACLRASGEGVAAAVHTAMRRGDGRAEILSIEMLGESGQPASVWRSGEAVEVRVAVRFREAVEDPVIGMLIRTRVGLNVYGTNTELEKLQLGPCAAGQVVRVSFAFRCELCAQEYTLTVASHDPDGVWHDWLEDAVAFSVVDSRYTAGVANLRARVTCILTMI
ncbi:MAG: Wzt carbohydrate-binding domain-containing protein [Bryobacteraceae bacterium]